MAGMGLGLDAADTDYAEYLRILLARSPAGPVRGLAASDHLLDPPETRLYTHPCPLCAQPALHADPPGRVTPLIPTNDDVGASTLLC